MLKYIHACSGLYFKAHCKFIYKLHIASLFINSSNVIMMPRDVKGQLKQEAINRRIPFSPVARKEKKSPHKNLIL
jgi:hypothetical protein